MRFQIGDVVRHRSQPKRLLTIARVTPRGLLFTDGSAVLVDGEIELVVRAPAFDTMQSLRLFLLHVERRRIPTDAAFEGYSPQATLACARLSARARTFEKSVGAGLGWVMLEMLVRETIGSLERMVARLDTIPLD